MPSTTLYNPTLAKILSFGRLQSQNTVQTRKCEVEKTPQPKDQQQAFARNL
ncbi:hypothetical protein [Dolichospermum circinale]|jgi:hypothetical protein|uniref:hypothetical protein n=1 Tax=Dolichospermum circinale TaxID=109265 RepID=UPI000429C8C4|nr:hypothetical protein [Dolichospermum circinale]MDB9482016.1 hypothetical protein [Dolichospermum circinale CS-537/05]MDB9452900.1 hypothetical protein [Dolichospermum circinale CS-541/06]MDB9461290.1 hypothetical protein [Dolichospermum circinale CS-541/04]MDB9474447.1 hypothetical protein [Dolichospermum circinale CS-537/11]MDB9478428.1 hypothetical protein [Dolichospermum circinale CS-537/03]